MQMSQAIVLVVAPEARSRGGPPALRQTRDRSRRTLASSDSRGLKCVSATLTFEDLPSRNARARAAECLFRSLLGEAF